MSTSTLKDFINVNAAAIEASCTPQAIRYLCGEGYFPGATEPLGKGRGWLIPRGEFAAFLRRRDKNLLPKGGRGRKAEAGKDLRQKKKLRKSAPETR